jgi:hypothetical protein
MGVGIGASGFIGIAQETVYGTYVAPTKFFPIDTESLKYTQATQYRTPIRQTADVIGVVEGDVNTAGDLSMDFLVDVVPYFLMASRTTVTKTGTAAPFLYHFEPTDAAVPQKSLSITLVRNGKVFAYTGCVVTTWTSTITDGVLKFNPSIIGSDELTESVPTPTWPDTVPFGAGTYNVSIPTDTQVFDADKFDIKIDDNGAAVFRLKNTGRGAQFIQFGERTVEMDVDRDFIDRTEYELYKTLTQRSITFHAEQDADTYFEFVAPVSIIDTYDLALGGQGDLVRASVTYRGIIDDTGVAYTVDISCAEAITVT